MELSELADAARAVLDEVERAVVGKRDRLELVLAGMLADGHVLLEDVPGLAKTLAARSFAEVTGLRFQRIQFTPDLLPSDVTGSSIWNQRDSAFEFRAGPIFANVLLADEINRAPPKTQAALLEAMQERQVSIDGETRALEPPFLVLATQNPIEYEGTYPLPEAQLDRFLFKVLVHYPALEAETEILRHYQHGFDPHRLDAAGVQAVATPADLAATQAELGQVRADDALLTYIAQIAEASRRSPDLLLGGSPRASIALLQAGRAFAAIQGRDYLVPDDIKALVAPIYRHRIILKPEAEIEGLTADRAIERFLGRVPVPR